MLSVASCYGNRDKLRPDGPLGPNADFTYLAELNASQMPGDCPGGWWRWAVLELTGTLGSRA